MLIGSHIDVLPHKHAQGADMQTEERVPVCVAERAHFQHLGAACASSAAVGFLWGSGRGDTRGLLCCTAAEERR
jgi:hypothetical protein